MKSWTISQKTPESFAKIMNPPIREQVFYKTVFSEENMGFSGNFHPAFV